jgi:hypothetical protein
MLHWINMKLIVMIFLAVIPVASFAQDIPVKELNQRLNDYYAQQPSLKVHLFVNQQGYLAGDTIFFKASAVYATTLTRIEKNTILNVVLLNPLNQIVSAEKIRLKSGTGNNQLVIPATITPGRYLLVAYHDWMKKSTPELYHQQYIYVAGEKEMESKQNEKNALLFFPEGGHFVTGVNNKIVVQGRAGQQGKVLNASEKEVAFFAIDSTGSGFFYLTPEPDQNYTAEILRESIRVPLPASADEGVSVLATVDGKNDQLRVIIQKPVNSTYNKVKLVADHQSDIYYSAEGKIDKEYATVIIPLTNVPGGISRLTIFSEAGSVLAERLFFVPHIPRINAQFEWENKTPGTREKITVKVKVTDAEGKPLKANASLTVFNKTSHPSYRPSAITDNWFLWSDLGKAPSDVPIFVANLNGSTAKKIDQLLIASAWKRAEWSEVLKKRESVIPYLNMRFTGETLDAKTGLLYTDSTFITFFFQKNVIAYHSFSSQGKFDIPLFLDFFGDEEVYYRVEKKGNRLDDIKVVLKDYPLFSYQQWPQAASLRNDLFYRDERQRQLINRSFGFFTKGSDYKKVIPLNALLEEEIFGPDVTINLDEYVLFPTMEETLREIVPMVQHRKVKNISEVRIYFADIDRMATGNPLYVIDGVITDDTDYFMALKPAEVASIKVVHSKDKLKTFGAVGKEGVILVDTKIPDNHLNVPRSKNSFRVNGLSEPVQVNAFNPATWQSRVPDLRTNLLWAPEIVTDENGEALITFYTSDVSGEFQIQTQGVTVNGEPFYQEETIKVSFMPASN